MPTMKPLTLLTVLLLALLPALAADEPGGSKLAELLKKITDENVDVRFAARSLAPEVGPPAVVPLGELLVHERREVALTARAALEKLVHHAGRRGADAERQPVAVELSKLLLPGRPAAVKREVLHLIAFIGGDPAVPAVSALLDDSDPHVREAARLSLERIPGKGSVAALLDAAKRLPAERKQDFIFSLSKKGDRSVVKELAALAASQEGEVKLSALEALARLGAPEAAGLIAAEIGRAQPADRERLYKEYLRLADNLKESDPAAAQAIYRRAIAEGPAGYQREHALGAACPPGSKEPLSLILAALTDKAPGVRRTAGLLLSELKGAEVSVALEKAYQESKGADRPYLLMALAQRDGAAARPYLERAGADESPELKIAALDLMDKLDDPRLEPVYLKSAESGEDWLKPIALKGYLILAKRKLDGGSKAEALPMFDHAIDLAQADGQRLEALRGVIAVGDPKAMGRLQSLLKDSKLGTEAAKGYVAFAALLGKNGDKATAEKRLMEIVRGDFPREIVSKAAEQMKTLGFDPQREAHAQGFVVDWWLVGPLQDPDGKGLERKYFPEEVIDLEKEHRIEARRYRWQKLTDKELTLTGRVDLVPIFRRSEKCVAYAYTELEFSSPREVLFKMGSDDGIACWLNGERLHLKPGPRSFKVDDDSIKARLAAGKNKVLLKINQTNGEWAFSFRLTDPEGKPIDMGALSAN
jgi:HEAT repeat protein